MTRSAEAAPALPTAMRSFSALDATFHAEGGYTSLCRVFESGALRLRQPRRSGGECAIVNTGGGIVAGDAHEVTFRLGTDCRVAVTSVAAEKVYRSESASVAEISARFELGPRSRLDWLPQETILFDAARLRRRVNVHMSGDATLCALEAVVFGRHASGEAMVSGSLRDGRRVHRDGRLVFADETCLEGPIQAVLGRKALGNGARAAALLLVVGPTAQTLLEPLRLALDPFAASDEETRVESGTSVRDGILVARCLTRSPEKLRAAMIAALAVVRAGPLPRLWS